MKHTWKQKAKCKSCNGTGIYRGLGEKGSVGVVCYKCKGKGEVELKIEWEDFEGKIKEKDIERVAEVNPGIIINEDPKFGGMNYDDWFKGKPFPLGSENRNFTCPAWWYQTANYKLKPNWPECAWGGSFSTCKNFKQKNRCWEKWDRENTKRMKKKVVIPNASTKD